MTVCGIAKADGVCVMGECPYIKMCCPAVWDKSGKPMTNEEYLKSCNTEQLAKWLSNHNAFIYECGQKQNIPKVMYEEDLEWWLKQPHTDKE